MRCGRAVWEMWRDRGGRLSARRDRNGASRPCRVEAGSTALISCRTNLSPFTKDCRVLRASNVSFLIFARSLPPTNSQRYCSSDAATEDYGSAATEYASWCYSAAECQRVAFDCSWEQRKDAGSRDQKFCCKLRHRRTYRSHRRQSAVTCSADPEPP